MSSNSDHPGSAHPPGAGRAGLAALIGAAVLIVIVGVGAARGSPVDALPGAPPPTVALEAAPTTAPPPTTQPTPATTSPVTTSPAPTTVPDTTTASSDSADTDGTGSTRSSVLDDLTDDQVRRLSRAVDACGTDATRACQWVLDHTGNDVLAAITQWFFGVALRILLVIAAAFVMNRMVRRGIGRYLKRLNRRSIEATRDDPSKAARSTLRMTTASSTLASIATVVIYTCAGLIILGNLGINLAPLLAGAGIAGVAVGFGAQNTVRDVFAGILVLVEDQYGVGDVIDAGRASGTVEDFSLRVTKLRDVEGTLWFVPNGSVQEVGNMSQVWSRSILDVEVSYGADHDHAGEVIKAAADRVWRERRDGATILEEPELWGVERLGESAVEIRVAVKTAPADQWKVSRILRSEIKRALDTAGIDIPFPQHTLWIRTLDGADQ